MWHVGGQERRYTGFLWGDKIERDHLENPGVDGECYYNVCSKTWDGEAWTGLIWLRIRTGGESL